MLQRPRNILKAYDRSSHQRLSGTSTRTLYFQGFGLKVRLSDISQAGSFTSTHPHDWDAVKAFLVDKWARVVLQRHLQRRPRRLFGRNMVKRSGLEQNLGLQSQSIPNCDFNPIAGIVTSTAPDCLDTAGNTSKEETLAVEKPASLGSESCLKEFNTHPGNSNTDHGRSNQREHSNRQPAIGPVDPMESNKKASGVSQSSHCQKTRKGGESTLQAPEQYISLKKKEAVARLMAAFNKWFDNQITAIESAYEASEASGGSSKGTGNTSSPDDNKPSKSSRGAKRQFDGDDQDNFSAGGDENGQDRGGNKRAKKDSEPGRMWACPFFKHDPKTFGKERCCAGPGWPSIHRLKEHLYRKHLLPKHACPRCSQPFKEKKDLESHLRADVRCEKVELVSVLGIDEATEAKLRMRKKYGPGVSEEQRWKDIYIMLFPNASRRSVPSPYYERNDAMALSSKAMLKRIKKELPALMQKRVESRFDQAEAELLNGFMDIARDALYEFCMGLPKNERSPSVTPVATPRSSTPSLPTASDSLAASSNDRAGEPSIDMSFCFDNTFFVGFDGFGGIDLNNNVFNFDGSADSFVIGDTSDSGYASTGTVGERSC
ncbi:hypothetical protein F5X99DRAFT_423300 [Biscogniauxia marginata]|nr:hypothetical protein F5X99DRAFT_423300 [Biscogniauxia marginata]